MTIMEMSAPDPALTFENDKRLICDIPGRYYITKADKPSQKVARHCQVKRICERALTLFGQPEGDVGDRVTVATENFGLLVGRLERRIGPMIMVELEMDDIKRAKLAKKVSWLQRKRVYQLSENRSSNRYEPQNQLSSILLADGHWEECLIADISVTGAAIIAERQVFVGDVVALGSVVSRVVRHTENGFAVKFITQQELSTLEAAVAPVRPVMEI